jgi:LmbE family N-acetylglucosaminyl deacetylase
MKKWLKILLSLNSLIKALGFQNFFLANKYNHHIEIVEEVKFKKALVIAPHPDDDCFGCGGLMKKVSLRGSVTVAYLCDGAGGVSDLTQKIDTSLIEKRKAEARAAGKILGVHEQIFFGYRDGKLAGAGAAVKAVSDLIKRIEPDIILLPSFLDNHPDHRAANEIVINALTKTPALVEIWAYEIWSPILANRIVMINQEIEAKKQAMQTQKSQLDARGYDKAILG